MSHIRIVGQALGGLLLSLVAIVLAATQPAFAQGPAYAVSPIRIELGPTDRTAEVTVANTGAAPLRFRIAVIDLVMQPDGQLERPEDGGPRPAHSAAGWVIATPTSLTIGPGQSQQVRLLVRRPADLPPGEYRAHLSVGQLPPPDAAGGLNEGADATGFAINIVTVYATSIPVVVTQGQTHATARLATAELTEDGHIAIGVTREGTASFRGYVEVAADGLDAPERLPVTIYPERDLVTRRYPLAALATIRGPITLTLFPGDLPLPDDTRPPPAPLPGTLTVPRP